MDARPQPRGYTDVVTELPWLGGLGRWWRRRSLRGRVTLAATAGLAVALAALPCCWPARCGCR